MLDLTLLFCYWGERVNLIVWFLPKCCISHHLPPDKTWVCLGKGSRSVCRALCAGGDRLSDSISVVICYCLCVKSSFVVCQPGDLVECHKSTLSRKATVSQGESLLFHNNLIVRKITSSRFFGNLIKSACLCCSLPGVRWAGWWRAWRQTKTSNTTKTAASARTNSSQHEAAVCQRVPRLPVSARRLKPQIVTHAKMIACIFITVWGGVVFSSSAVCAR